LKRWPVERLAKVASWITEKNFLILLFCGPESATAQEMIRQTRHPDQIVTVSAVHLRQVAALLSRCVASVSNDTGIAHIAAAVGVPGVTVFGPTSPTIYLPPGATAVTGDLDCPYRNAEGFGPPECVVAGRCLVDSQSCINVVDIQDVVKNLQAIIDRQSRRKKPSQLAGPLFLSEARLQFGNGSVELTST
jgi:ADP-heptose:LPS heptosyltransferase